MDHAHVLLVFPGSLYGGSWAQGPVVKPELVTLFTELRRAGHTVDVLDLEAEFGNPADDESRDAFLNGAEQRLRTLGADLVVISCWSAQQYGAAVAVAESVRRHHPDAVIAVAGYHVTVRPGDFEYEAAPFDWLVVGEAENAVLTIAQAVAEGERRHGGPRQLEGTPFPLDEAHLPGLAAYPYAHQHIAELGVFLSRGCPYNAPACLLRPGGGGWHSFGPEVALKVLEAAGRLAPRRLDVLDPAFGYDPAWRRAVLERLAATDRRDLAISITGRPDALTRVDLDRMYAARVRLRLDVGALSPALLSRTGGSPQPRRAVEHALDLLAYANAKGILTVASFTFNQPGETLVTARETLSALEDFVAAAPNASVYLQAQSWAYIPAGDPVADLDVPGQRYGTRVLSPEWWKEAAPYEATAKAVVASAELSELEPGDDSYWRPRFEELQGGLEDKLTYEAQRGLRSHESVGAAAYGVPGGWWMEPRWH